MNRAAAEFQQRTGQPRLPYLRLLEDLNRARPAHIDAGTENDRYFLDGWHPPIEGPNVTARYTNGVRGVMRIPILQGHDHLLRLRLDPFSGPGAPRQVVRVSLNGIVLEEFELRFNPSRIGLYEVEVPRELIVDGMNTLALEGTQATQVPEDTAYRFARAGQRVAFLVWYVDVRPVRRDTSPQADARQDLRVNASRKRVPCSRAWPRAVRCNRNRRRPMAPTRASSMLRKYSPPATDPAPSATSKLLSAGVPAHVVQQRLGHKGVETTLSLYAHVLPGQHRDAARQLGSLLYRR